MQQNDTALSKAEFEILILSPDYGPQKTFTQLYHYTNDNAKQGIVYGKRLDFQLTRTNAFLDKNEGTAILEPYYHACGHLYETGQIDRDFFMIARSITAQMLREHDSGLWALCLTPHGCSPFMKERYAAKDGWIISFCSGSLDDLISHFPEKYGRFERVQMQYSFGKVKRLLESILKKIFKAYKKDLQNCNYDLTEQVHKILLHLVSYYGLRYKGKDYREEKEERLLFHLNTNVESFVWKYKSKKLKVTFNDEEGQKSMHLIIGPSYFCQVTQEMSVYNDERLNSSFLRGETIQKVLNEEKR